MGLHVQVCPEAPTRDEEASLPAGTIVDQGTGAPRKIRWTMNELLKHYPKETWKRFIPPVTRRVEWGRLVITFIADQENLVPPIHYDIYMESIRSDKDLVSPRQPSDIISRAVPYDQASGLMVTGTGLPEEDR